MKKIIFTLLALATVFTLCSCKDKEEEKKTEEVKKEVNEETQTFEKIEDIFGEKVTGFDLKEGYETPIIFR